MTAQAALRSAARDLLRARVRQAVEPTPSADLVAIRAWDALTLAVDAAEDEARLAGDVGPLFVTNHDVADLDPNAQDFS